MMAFTITSASSCLIRCSTVSSGSPADLGFADDRHLHGQSCEDAFVEAVGELTKFLERKGRELTSTLQCGTHHSAGDAMGFSKGHALADEIIGQLGRQQPATLNGLLQALSVYFEPTHQFRREKLEVMS